MCCVLCVARYVLFVVRDWSLVVNCLSLCGAVVLCCCVVVVVVVVVVVEERERGEGERDNSNRLVADSRQSFPQDC